MTREDDGMNLIQKQTGLVVVLFLLDLAVSILMEWRCCYDLLWFPNKILISLKAIYAPLQNVKVSTYRTIFVTIYFTLFPCSTVSAEHS